MIRRREFITLLGGAAAWPPTVRAQQSDAPHRVGVLMGFDENDPMARTYLIALREELQKHGWVEGRNIRTDVRWAKADDPDARRRLAMEVVTLQPNVIISHNTPTTAALLQQTRTIPIVFAIVSDPVGSGFVESFARPRGNVTGFTNIEPTIAGKWMELLREIAPGVHRILFLYNPTTAPYAEYYLRPFKSAAASSAVEAMVASVHNMPELETVIAAHSRAPNGGLVVMTDSFMTAHRAEIVSLAARYRLPGIYPFRSFVESGGLVSYGNELIESFRRAGSYADRILNGAKPSELPIQAPVQFELVINLKTAKALGLDVPPTLLARADEVIE